MDFPLAFPFSVHCDISFQFVSMAFGRLLMLPLFGLFFYAIPWLLAEKLIKLHLERSNGGWHIAEPEGRAFAESLLFGQPMHFPAPIDSGKRSKRDTSAKNVTSSVEGGGTGATTRVAIKDKEFARKVTNARVVVKIGHIGALVSP